MTYQPTARVLTVLELLQTHGFLNGYDLAARLEVDVRTIRRYITTLQDIGIPIEAEIGRYGGYMLRPGFKLPPLMFSNEEVLVLVLGLLLVRRSPLSDAGTAIESAFAKIERVLPIALREQLRALQETMQLDAPTQEIEVKSSLISMLSLAARQHRQVRMAYSSRSDSNERTVDPYSVICYQEHWYTVGYCHLRQGLRVFRLDRVQSAVLLSDTFDSPADFDTFAYMLASFEAIPDEWVVEVLLGMSIETARRRIPHSLATLVQEQDQIYLRASIRDLEAMARFLIGLNCSIKILEPPALREVFLKIGAEITQIARD